MVGREQTIVMPGASVPESTNYLRGTSLNRSQYLHKIYPKLLQMRPRNCSRRTWHIILMKTGKLWIVNGILKCPSLALTTSTVARWIWSLEDKNITSYKSLITRPEARSSKANLPDVWAAKSQVSLYQWAGQELYGRPFESIILDVLTRS